MPLTGPQLKRFVDTFAAAFPNIEGLAEMVAYVDLTPRRSLVSITTAGTLPAQVRELITTAEAEGWLPKLVEHAATSNPGAPGLAALRDEIKPLILAAAVNHYRAVVMGDRLLINRDAVRGALERLSNAQKRIVIVDGEPVTGKSHTVWFIRYLRDNFRSFGLIWIDLRELVAASPDGLIEPTLLARSMVKQMSLDPALVPERGEQTWAAWTSDFCDGLTGKLSAAEKPWWLVIDNFTAVRLPQETLDLVKKLCERLAINIPSLYLVLLGYRETMPPQVEADIEREQIARIDAAEVGLFFKELYDSRQIPVTEAEIALKVVQVLRSVDPAHPRRLEIMGAELTKIARTILQEAGQP
jgi:hypothetical protein